MEMNEHYKRLQRVYASAPIVRFYNTSYIRFTDENTVATLQVEAKYFHAQKAMHGSVYFRMLDDAAYFASAAKEPDFFLVTKTFTTNLLRPVSKGKIRAVGTVTGEVENGYTAKAELFDENDLLLATGNGEFVRTGTHWTKVFGYSS